MKLNIRTFSLVTLIMICFAFMTYFCYQVKYPHGPDQRITGTWRLYCNGFVFLVTVSSLNGHFEGTMLDIGGKDITTIAGDFDGSSIHFERFNQGKAFQEYSAEYVDYEDKLQLKGVGGPLNSSTKVIWYARKDHWLDKIFPQRTL